MNEPYQCFISNDEYHKENGISRSMLMDFRRSPTYYYAKHIGKTIEPVSSKAFQLGSMVHTLALEPHLFDKQYITAPELEEPPKAGLLKDLGREEYDKQKVARDAAKKRNDEALELFNEIKTDKEVCAGDDFRQALMMSESLETMPLFEKVKQGAEIEKSIFFTHEPTGLLCKVRPDVLNGGVVADLKTTNDLSPRSFMLSAIKYGYFLQAGMIKRALEAQGKEMMKFIIFAVEKNKPFDCVTYSLAQECIDYGERMFDELMGRLSDCLTSNRWCDTKVRVLTLPEWLLKEETNNVY